ncbi:MAG: TRAP transporter substrate-binding protein [Alphaproteobacteria bacterium]|nr:TRAP transporter substrate-binding protein [Alphaproteobacteria bacterium]
MRGWTTIVAAALAVASGAAAQDKPVELRFSLWVPPQHSNTVKAREWGESLSKATNGSIKVTVFPAQQLGRAFDHFDMTKDGIADVGHLSLGYEPGRLPIAAISNAPFMMTNAKGGSRALHEWYSKYAPRDMPEVKFCLAYAHDPGAIHSKRPITHPDHIKGLKVRPAHATMGQFVTLLGGTNVQASAPESREILERGVADAITFPWESMFIFGIDKAVSHHLDMPFYVATFAWIINKAKYEGMSAAQKKAVDDHCNLDWVARVADPWAEQEAAGKEKMGKTAGHTLNKPSAAEIAAWRKAAEPIRAQWDASVQKLGLDPKAVYGDLEAALKKHNSLY